MTTNGNILDYFAITDIKNSTFPWFIRDLGDGKLLNYITDKRRELMERVEDAYVKNRKISAMSSLELLRSTFLDTITECINEGNNTSIDNVLDNSIRKIMGFEEIQGCVIRSISGVSINTESINISGFTITKSINTLITNATDKIHKPTGNLFILTPEFKFYDATMAYSIADTMIEKLANVIYFIIGSTSDEFQISMGGKCINDTHGQHYFAGNRREHIVVANKIHSSSYNNDIRTLIPLDDEIFRSTKHRYYKLLNMLKLEITSATSTDMHSRIIKSAIWCGKALHTQNPTDSFIYGAIALEILLCHDDSGPFKPSIVSSISSMAGMMLGKTADERLKIAQRIKNIYAIRSSIVHSGRAKFSSSDHMMLLAYTRKCILKLIEDATLNTIPSAKELYVHFERLKMSF